MNRLKDKITVITGGASGIGRAASIKAAEEGAIVVIADINEAKGHEAVEIIKANGGEAYFKRTDITSDLECKQLIESTNEQFGRVDVLYNNAGIDITKSMEEITSEDIDIMLNVNLKGTFSCCKHVLPIMQSNGGGVIVNQGSVAGFVANTKNSVYCATKAGVILYTKALALDYGKYNIRVNAVCPGYTQTEMVEGYFDAQDDPDSARKRVYEKHPLGRIAQTEDIAKGFIYLASDDSSFVSGTTLLIDGGLLSYFE